MSKQALALIPYKLFLFTLVTLSCFTSAYGQEDLLDKQDDFSLGQLVLTEIEKGKKELAKLNLKHSPKKITYFEVLKRSDGVEIKLKKKKTDFVWKEIGLKLLNLNTGKTRIVKVRKAGIKLTSFDVDLVILLEVRPSGIAWNEWNTGFQVTDLYGQKWVVVLNRFPRYLKNGRREDVIYSPYSTALHINSLADEGSQYLDSVIYDAYLELFQRQPAFMKIGRGFVDISPIKRLALIEQVDPFELSEFINGRWLQDPFQRVNIILATNRGTAYAITSSSASATGLMQFTNASRGRKLGTWDQMTKVYPWAGLPSFKVGTRNHKESIKAAILLNNHNAGSLEAAFSSKIWDDPNLEYYLAAMYNGGGGPVINAVRALYSNLNDWRQELRKLKKTNESIEYLDKLDYLLANKN